MDYFMMLISIIFVNLLLSGDNALVIALASRRLPKVQQKNAIIWGGAGAVGLRILLTIVAVQLLQIPYLQLAGGILLLWVAVKLNHGGHEERKAVKAAGTLYDAIRTIIVADLVMSLDNVVAIAGVAKGNMVALSIGLAISIPIIIWGSRLTMDIMNKWPVIVRLGAAFLGWTAGSMLLNDFSIKTRSQFYPSLEFVVPAAFAAIVLISGFVFMPKIKKGRA